MYGSKIKFNKICSWWLVRKFEMNCPKKEQSALQTLKLKMIISYLSSQKIKFFI